MPRFSPDADDITIYPYEFMDACNKDDIQEVINWLVENGKVKEDDTNPSDKIGIVQSMFEEYLYAIRDSYHQLTNEEEEIIVKIGKKFKI